MKISLLENAYGFLEESLDKAIAAEKNQMLWKYAILNLVQAIELSLKEKLRREHSVLIFDKIDSPKNTVNIITALNRLQHICSIKLSKADINTILKASIIRNDIVHFEVELNAVENKIIFAKLLGFISHFNFIHLDSALDEIITFDLWQEAISIIEYAEELYERAKCIFEEKKFDFELIWACTNCQYEAFVIEDEINTCYVCGFKSDIFECHKCKNLFYKNECHELQIHDEQFENFCTTCYEDIISEEEAYYHDRMSHFFYK